jgi:xyloglucan-specific exo-beta-1,4-glucanase
MIDRRQALTALAVSGITAACLATISLPGAAARAAIPAANAHANYRWRNVKVGGGGFIPGLLFSPVERGLAYARSDMGGAYRWDAQAKTWRPLQDGFADAQALGIESLAPDPVDAEVVYVAAGTYGRDPAMILRSRDRGRSWDRISVSFRMGGNEGGRGLGERLAVDPANTAVLYYGSRHDGLQRSLDKGSTWARVDAFPSHGLGAPLARSTHAGISFVVIDREGGAANGRSRVLFAGLADPGPHHLYRSDDGGETWAPVAGEPGAELLPAKAEIDGQGRLYVSYVDHMGPNGVTDGALWRLDTKSGAWTDITPDRGAHRPAGGYMGLSLARSQPGTLVAASLNRASPGDDIWRSTDGGDSWHSLRDHSTRDVSASPFLLWGGAEASFGWWIAALAIDPFDAETVSYATGATVYVTHEASRIEHGGTVGWSAWVEGIEQTAVITLASPPQGPVLLSGFGDISGFAHDDLAVSPSTMFSRPVFNNTITIDFAGQAPNVVVRSGTPHASGASLAWSGDGGHTWQGLAVSRPAALAQSACAGGGRGCADPWRDAALAVSADGSTFMLCTPLPAISRDRGATWQWVKGLPVGLRPIADRVDPQRFYALDFDTAALWVSIDGGASFTREAGRGLPASLAADRPWWREVPWPLKAAPDAAGALWMVSKAGLFRSADGGKSFTQMKSDLQVEMLDFGKPAQGKSDPTLFAIGSKAGLRAVWRSDDLGRSWLRVNDAEHEYGRRFRCIAADQRVFGRVYLGTDGRGILYGEPNA